MTTAIRVHKRTEVVNGLVHHALHACHQRNTIACPPDRKAVVGWRPSSLESLAFRVRGSPIWAIVSRKGNRSGVDIVLLLRDSCRLVVHVATPHLPAEPFVIIFCIKRHPRARERKCPAAHKRGQSCERRNRELCSSRLVGLRVLTCDRTRTMSSPEQSTLKSRRTETRLPLVSSDYQRETGGR
jgi:hypothetical protein